MAQVTNQVFYATTYHPIQAGSIDGTDTAPHDNAVYRALLASSTGLYDPTGDPKAVGDPYCTLFVGRLARHTTEETLNMFMSKFGKVKGIRLVRHIVTGASQGYAFVEFEDEQEMLYAYEMAYNNVVDGSQILVDYNRQQLMPGWIPRRLGGGLGGRKESGQLRFGGRDRPFRAPLRPIPGEQLTKLGIPLPPVGRYVSRFLLPPLPRRPGSSKEDRRRQRGSEMDLRKETPAAELTVGNRRVLEDGSSLSPARRFKEDEAAEDGGRSGSSSRHKRRRHSVQDDRQTVDHYKRGGKDENERSYSDIKRHRSEGGDELESRERFRTHESENFHRHKRYHRPETVFEEYDGQRYQYSEHSTDRYKDQTDHERRSPGVEVASHFGHRDDGRGGIRSLSRESAEYDKKPVDYGRNAKHGHDRRENKWSRSRERAHNDDIRSPFYEEEGRSKSRHGEEERKQKRSRKKDTSNDA